MKGRNVSGQRKAMFAKNYRPNFQKALELRKKGKYPFDKSTDEKIKKAMIARINKTHARHKSHMIKIMPQTGTRKSILADKAIKALPPGERESSTTGKKYWETRRNRSDRVGSRL